MKRSLFFFSCCLLLSCSRQQREQTVQEYVEQLEEFMHVWSIDNLVVAVSTGADWIDAFKSPYAIATYRVIYSFDPAFELGDRIVERHHCEDGIATIEDFRWVTAQQRQTISFMGLSYDAGTDSEYGSFYTEETVIPDGTQDFVRRTYYNCAGLPLDITGPFERARAGDTNVRIETNKILEAYFILQGQYRDRLDVIKNHTGKPIVWTSEEEAEQLRKQIEKQGREAVYVSSGGFMGTIKSGHRDPHFPHNDKGKIWLVE